VLNAVTRDVSTRKDQRNALSLKPAIMLTVACQPDGNHRVRYLRQPFRRAELFARGEEPT
jgi:hypothetical protein